MSEIYDEDLIILLWILIPISIVVLFILCVEGLSPRWSEIASNAWLIVLIYALFVSLYGLYNTF